ncbi:MAG: hypothetical protein AB8C84_09940, partial [Oligoflexales bacterium]
DSIPSSVTRLIDFKLGVKAYITHQTEESGVSYIDLGASITLRGQIEMTDTQLSLSCSGICLHKKN